MQNNGWPNPDQPGVPVEPERDGLPRWEQCEAAVKCGDASPMQRFIYEHEPAGGDPDWGPDVAWRTLLAAAVEKARAEEREECAKVADELDRAHELRGAHSDGEQQRFTAFDKNMAMARACGEVAVAIRARGQALPPLRGDGIHDDMEALQARLNLWGQA